MFDIVSFNLTQSFLKQFFTLIRSGLDWSQFKWGCLFRSPWLVTQRMTQHSTHKCVGCFLWVRTGFSLWRKLLDDGLASKRWTSLLHDLLIRVRECRSCSLRKFPVWTSFLPFSIFCSCASKQLTTEREIHESYSWFGSLTGDKCFSKIIFATAHECEGTPEGETRERLPSK